MGLLCIICEIKPDINYRKQTFEYLNITTKVGKELCYLAKYLH